MVAAAASLAHAQHGDAGAADLDAAELVAPVLLEAFEPHYPEHESRRAEVELELTLDEGGTVVAVEVIQSGGDAFDAAATEAAWRLRFIPARRGDAGIAAQIPFRFTFEPPQQAPPSAATGTAPAPSAPDAKVAGAIPDPASAPVIGSAEIEVRGRPPLREPTRRTLELEQIRTVPGTGGDVLRSVETMPGVARPAWGDGTLIVRGSAPEDTLVFVDGTPVPFAYHLGDGPSIVPGDLLDRLDFYPGNFGPAFGRGMGGVIDVGLRSPRRDRVHGLAQVDVIDARAMVEAPLGARTGLLVAARRSWLDAWLGSVLEDSGTRLATAPVYWDGQVVLEHDLSPFTRARLSVFGADDRVTVVVSSPSEHDPVTGGEIGGHARFLRTQLRLETEITESSRIVNTLSWGLTDSSQRFGGDGFDWLIHGVAIRSALRADLARFLTLDAGIDALFSRYDVEARFRPYPDSNAVPGPYFARPSRAIDVIATLWRPAAYAGLEVRPARGLRVMPSVRADYPHDAGSATFDPRLHVRWDAIETPRRTTLKAGLGLYHQPPLPEQSVDPVGTEGIESNRALHASAGVEQELAAAVSVEVEGFYKRLSNLVIARSDEARVIGARFDNTGDGHVLGAELLLRYGADDWFSGWLAYTLSRSERRAAADEPYETFEWDQTHVLSAVGELDLGRRWTLGARVRYVSGAPYTPYRGGVVDLDAGAYAPRPEARHHSARLDPFHQLDLRLEKTWELGFANLGAYLEVRNVYNRRSAEGVTYSYDYAQRAAVEGLPILPVAGVRGEL